MFDPLALEDCLQFDNSGAILPTIITSTDEAFHAPQATATSPAVHTTYSSADGSLAVPNPSASNGLTHEFNQFEVAMLEDSVCVEEGGVRSDGSDSGLGLEPTSTNSVGHEEICDAVSSRTAQSVGKFKLRMNISSIVCKFGRFTLVLSVDVSPPTPLRTALKRRSDTSIPDVHAAFGDCLDSGAANDATTSAKRAKRNIQFSDVTVFYFQRQQGFMCVPSQGGCSLGMAAQHMYRRRFTLAEYAAEQRRVQRHKMQILKRNAGLPVSSSEDSAGGSDDEYGCIEGSQHVSAATGVTPTSGCSPADATTTAASDSDDTESPGIQPVSARQRRVLLKAAGVRKIDAAEKKECRDILQSRDNCGCTCRGFCDPETCACAQSGIKCQVDRLHYPCGCTRDGCGNAVGRAEFNKARVNTHYIHTFLRLQMESKTPPPLPLPPVPVVSAQPLLLPAMAAHGPTQHPLPVAAGGNGWHSQVGRSLAAMSGDNLYNMNGATTTITPAAAPQSVHHGLMPLALDQTPDLHYAYGGGDDIVYELPAAALTGGSLHNNGLANPFDCFAGSSAAAGSNCGSGSGLNTPTNLLGSGGGSSPAAPAFVVMSATTSASMYSPDSASIVEPPAATASPLSNDLTAAIADDDYNHPPTYPAETNEVQTQSAAAADTSGGGASFAAALFPDYGDNITGYQHSYLYSLQQQQQLPPEPTPDQAQQKASSSHSSSHVGHNGYLHSYLNSLQQHQRTAAPTPSTSSTAVACSSQQPPTAAVNENDEDLLDLEINIQYSGDSNQSVENEFAFEPIDYESELDMATTFIDKSLKTCVVPPGVASSLATSGTSASTNGHQYYPSDSESG